MKSILVMLSLFALSGNLFAQEYQEYRKDVPLIKGGAEGADNCRFRICIIQTWKCGDEGVYSYRNCAEMSFNEKLNITYLVGSSPDFGCEMVTSEVTATKISNDPGQPDETLTITGQDAENFLAILRNDGLTPPPVAQVHFGTFKTNCQGAPLGIKEWSLDFNSGFNPGDEPYFFLNGW